MEMTITRALTELKVLNGRIEKACAEPFIGLVRGASKVPVSKHVRTADELESQTSAALKSAMSLIKRRNDIKSAVVASNASTMVTIGKQSMTVAQAIERKNSIHLEEKLLDSIKQQLAVISRELGANEQAIFKSVEAQLLAMAGGQQGHKIDEEQQQAITKGFENLMKYEVVDPNKLSKVMADLSASITEFLGEVDHALSESNALTRIVVQD